MLFGEFLAGHTQKTVVFNPLDNLPIMALTVLLELKCMFQMASPRASLDLEAFFTRRLLAGAALPRRSNACAISAQLHAISFEKRRLQHLIQLTAGRASVR